jgi:hypothetical protein
MADEQILVGRYLLAGSGVRIADNEFAAGRLSPKRYATVATVQAERTILAAARRADGPQGPGRPRLLASDGVQGGVVDGVDSAVGGDDGGGVGLGVWRVEANLFGQGVGGQIPAVEHSVLVVHDH